jgi:hypothetical protein
VAVGVNKAADQFQILDERTREEMASGKYHDQRRAMFGRPARPATPTPPTPAKPTVTPAKPTVTPAKPTATPTSATPARPGRPAPRRTPWTRSQQRLTLLYNEQGLRPDDIARKVGLSRYAVTQIILAAKNRGKL